jgi:hypothetical protein
MKNVTQFDRVTLKALRAEMQAVLDKFGAGIQFEVGNMKFSEAEVDIKIKATIKGAVTRTDKQLELYAKMAGIVNMKNAFGDELVKYNSRSYKYPFVYKKASDGKMYKIDASMAKLKFA